MKIEQLLIELKKLYDSRAANTTSVTILSIYTKLQNYVSQSQNGTPIPGDMLPEIQVSLQEILVNPTYDIYHNLLNEILGELRIPIHSETREYKADDFKTHPPEEFQILISDTGTSDLFQTSSDTEGKRSGSSPSPSDARDTNTIRNSLLSLVPAIHDLTIDQTIKHCVSTRRKTQEKGGFNRACFIPIPGEPLYLAFADNRIEIKHWAVVIPIEPLNPEDADKHFQPYLLINEEKVDYQHVCTPIYLDKLTGIRIFPRADLTLGQFVSNNQITFAQFRSILGQILLGLKSLHEKGLVHREIRDANILVYNKDADFPLVKLADLNSLARVDSDGRIACKDKPSTYNDAFTAPEVMALMLKINQKFILENVDFRKADLFSIARLVLTLYKRMTSATDQQNQLILEFIQKLHAGWDSKKQEELSKSMSDYLRYSESLEEDAMDKSDHLRRKLNRLILALKSSHDPEKRFTLQQAMDHPLFGDYPELFFSNLEQQFKHTISLGDFPLRPWIGLDNAINLLPQNIRHIHNKIRGFQSTLKKFCETPHLSLTKELVKLLLDLEEKLINDLSIPLIIESYDFDPLFSKIRKLIYFLNVKIYKFAPELFVARLRNFENEIDELCISSNPISDYVKFINCERVILIGVTLSENYHSNLKLHLDALLKKVVVALKNLQKMTPTKVVQKFHELFSKLETRLARQHLSLIKTTDLVLAVENTISTMKQHSRHFLVGCFFKSDDALELQKARAFLTHIQAISTRAISDKAAVSQILGAMHTELAKPGSWGAFSFSFTFSANLAEQLGKYSSLPFDVWIELLKPSIVSQELPSAEPSNLPLEVVVHGNKSKVS